jgi:hypothetical protein
MEKIAKDEVAAALTHVRKRFVGKEPEVSALDDIRA